MEKFQNSVDDITKALKENLHLLETRHVVCQDPVNKDENLNDTCEKFSRLAKENKWRIWWKTNIRSIQLAFSFIGIILFFLLLIGLIKIIF
jgi:lysylphosphatidylglycerol synthetase-like protein (DUF2156 family)